MINPTLITNIGQIVIWSGKIINGSIANTGVYVNLNIHSDFTNLYAPKLDKGSISGNVWTIGNLAPNEIVNFEFQMVLSSTTIGFDTDYSFKAEVFGLDTILTNNILEDKVHYKVETCNPMGSSNDSVGSCLCVDVSQYGTPCSEGNTEYRLNISSITNGEMQYWDVTTGLGGFTPIDPTKPITFTYDTYCIKGVDEYQISCNTLHTIYPQLKDKSIWYFTIQTKCYDDLSSTELNSI
ncbi:MAG: hypothetical protein KC414_08005, partial [Romboutsia sp.]|nr:hypothetical protein [Romboutsia sp.]